MFVKDQMDHDILKKVGEHPGIQLCQLSREIGKSLVKTRYRIYTLERSGFLRLEKNRGNLNVYPKP